MTLACERYAQRSEREGNGKTAERYHDLAIRAKWNGFTENEREESVEVSPDTLRARLAEAEARARDAEAATAETEGERDKYCKALEELTSAFGAEEGKLRERLHKRTAERDAARARVRVLEEAGNGILLEVSKGNLTQDSFSASCAVNRLTVLLDTPAE